jgi:sn-glycerol 3-phosphate transport system permease protein
MISSAFKLPDELFTTEIHLIPDRPTLENFKIALFEYDFIRWFINSIITTLGISIGQIIIAILAAFAMCYYKTRFNEIIFYVLIATMVIPFQVTMIPNYILMSKMGLLNTRIAVILPTFANATTFFFIRQHFRSVPYALYEAAKVEGANSFWILRKVVIVLCKGSISAMFILCVIDGWNQYFWPLLVLTKSEMRTLTVGLQQFLDFEMGNRWGPFMATATMASLPIIIIYLFIQRNIIEAFVNSGVKG